jgi:hypothetical protein
MAEYTVVIFPIKRFDLDEQTIAKVYERLPQLWNAKPIIRV